MISKFTVNYKSLNNSYILRKYQTFNIIANINK